MRKLITPRESPIARPRSHWSVSLVRVVAIGLVCVLAWDLVRWSVACWGASSRRETVAFESLPLDMARAVVGLVQDEAAHRIGPWIHSSSSQPGSILVLAAVWAALVLWILRAGRH
jgi:hypothetical protein